MHADHHRGLVRAPHRRGLVRGAVHAGLAVLIGAVALLWAWNAAVASIWSLPEIRFVQAAALTALLAVGFGIVRVFGPRPSTERRTPEDRDA